MSESPETAKLLAEAAKHKMTPEEIRAQKISWLAGELGIEHPDWSEDECRERARRAVDQTEAIGELLAALSAAGLSASRLEDRKIVCLPYDLWREVMRAKAALGGAMLPPPDPVAAGVRLGLLAAARWHEGEAKDFAYWAEIERVNGRSPAVADCKLCGLEHARAANHFRALADDPARVAEIAKGERS